MRGLALLVALHLGGGPRQPDPWFSTQMQCHEQRQAPHQATLLERSSSTPSSLSSRAIAARARSSSL